MVLRRLIPITGLAIALIVTVHLIGFAGRDGASAADAETAALISHFNVYRASQGVGALSTSASLNQGAQAAAEDSAQSCSFQLPSGSGLKWGAYGYVTGDQLWNAYEEDPILLPAIADPKYHSVGVGRVYSGCNLGHIWIMWLSTQGGGSTPVPTPTPTPTGTPTPTAQPSTTGSPILSPLPTSSPSPSEADDPTPTPTETTAPEPTPTPAPTVPPELQGDVTCDGYVNAQDAIAVLGMLGGVTGTLACGDQAGPDCRGGIDGSDVLILMQFLAGLPTVPDGDCPSIGSPIATPAPTPAPIASDTPIATPTPIPSYGSGASDHCWLTMIAYDMTYAGELTGEQTCVPDSGPGYTCMFPEQSKQVFCEALTEGFSGYECFVFDTLDVTCIAVAAGATSDYTCGRGEIVLCTSGAGPDHACVVAQGLATCTSEGEFSWSPGAS